MRRGAREEREDRKEKSVESSKRKRERRHHHKGNESENCQKCNRKKAKRSSNSKPRTRSFNESVVSDKRKGQKRGRGDGHKFAKKHRYSTQMVGRGQMRRDIGNVGDESESFMRLYCDEKKVQSIVNIDIVTEPRKDLGSSKKIEEEKQPSGH